MSLNLAKGGSLNLTKTSSTTRYYAGLGWPDVGLDLDVTVVQLAANGQVPSNAHVLFYNQKNAAEGFANDSMIHNGDNRSGSAPGDDESVIIDTAKIGADITEVAILVTMHDAPGKTFRDLGTTEPTSIRICENDKDGKEMAKYVVTDLAPDATCLQFGSLIRQADNTWEFQAVGAGGVADLSAVLSQYGAG